MKYQIALLVAVFCVLFSVSEAKPSQVCSPGSTFKIQCNQCRCNTEGSDMVCTKQICFADEDTTPEESQINQKASEAITEEKKTEESAVETKAANVDESPAVNSENSEKDDDTCTPGQTYKKECNECTCSISGRKSASVCTLLTCDSMIQREE